MTPGCTSLSVCACAQLFIVQSRFLSLCFREWSMIDSLSVWFPNVEQKITCSLFLCRTTLKVLSKTLCTKAYMVYFHFMPIWRHVSDCVSEIFRTVTKAGWQGKYCGDFSHVCSKTNTLSLELTKWSHLFRWYTLILNKSKNATL